MYPLPATNLFGKKHASQLRIVVRRIVVVVRFGHTQIVDVGFTGDRLNPLGSVGQLIEAR